MRRKARVDANHRDVVDALRAIGCSVADTSGAGSGFPDIVVGVSGINLMVEIKDGSKPPSERRLTPDQKDFHASWSGQVAVVNSVAEAVTLVTQTREKLWSNK